MVSEKLNYLITANNELQRKATKYVPSRVGGESQDVRPSTGDCCRTALAQHMYTPTEDRLLSVQPGLQLEVHRNSWPCWSVLSLVRVTTTANPSIYPHIKTMRQSPASARQPQWQDQIIITKKGQTETAKARTRCKTPET